MIPATQSMCHARVPECLKANVLLTGSLVKTMSEGSQGKKSKGRAAQPLTENLLLGTSFAVASILAMMTLSLSLKASPSCTQARTLNTSPAGYRSTQDTSHALHLWDAAQAMKSRLDITCSKMGAKDLQWPHQGA